MATTDPVVPDWIEPGREVFLMAYRKDTHEPHGRPRRVTVSRVGPRYIIVTDAMSNESKFNTATLSKPRSDGGTDILKSPLDPAFSEEEWNGP